MDRIIGIDLGTTNSVVAYYEQGQTIVIPNSEGSRITPSIVFYKSPDEIVVGELAKRHFLTHPKQTIRSVKRFIGARFTDIAERTQTIHYDLMPGPNDEVLIDVGWTQVSPEQVSAEILKKMKETAEDYFGEAANRAVVTVPAYFNDNQRAATKRAGEMAGLEVVRIINEPTAAALAYGLNRGVGQRIAVFDFGGGTFDISVLEIDNEIFEVKATNGDTFLGGDNIDEAIYQDILKTFAASTGVDLSNEVNSLQRVREGAEKIKCELSSVNESTLTIPFISANEKGPIHLDYHLSRARLRELMAPLMPRLIGCCRKAVADAHLSPKELTGVLLVGGSTRIPAVQDLVRQEFMAEPNRSLHPDEAVAIGAAIQGSILSGALREVLLLDVTPLSLGIEIAGGLFSPLIPRNSSIPAAVHKSFTTVRDNQNAVRIHVLQGERKVAHENQSLGYFRLTGIAPAPKEIPEIDVCFQIDANGILNVSATDATSGASNSIVVENYTMISPEDAEQLVKAAEGSADADKAFLRLAFVRSQAYPIQAAIESALQDETLDESIVRDLREATFRFDVAMNSEDSMEIEKAFTNLREIAKQYQDLLSEDGSWAGAGT